MYTKVTRELTIIIGTAVFLIAAILVKGYFSGVYASAQEPVDHEVYPEFGMVIELREDTDSIVIQTRDGNQWKWHGIEDWFNGDFCILAMDNNGTPDLHDDEIVGIRYIVLGDEYIPEYFKNMVASL